MITNTPIGWLRVTGFLEGLSYLLLLFIAMPLKYIWDLPQAVRVIGMIHGILFVAFVWLIVYCKIIYRWPFSKMLWLGIASLLPFGPFIADYRLLRNEEKKA